MSDDESIRLDIDGAVATVILNRPQSLNALDPGMSRRLRDVTEQLETDATIRVVVLRGAGEHFMAGGDVKWFQMVLDNPADARRHILERLIAEVHASVIRLRRMAKPVVASVQGAVVGFGMSLMSACDFAIAADNSYFSLAYCQIGATPDGGATYALPRLVGIKQAMEIALLGDRLDARRAQELGLINRVVPLSDLAAETQIIVARLAQGPTAAYGRTKRLINESFERSLTEQLLAELDCFADSAVTADFAEGVNAFVDKRKPKFIGG
ncbi:MAG: enoyl-CoA hydratase-related protein [Proteobacteria bacterium]|nr:enoyl-CoA hydratase-related protein [Pseudomonadota bacterium]